MLTQEKLKECLDYDQETGIFLWKIKRKSVNPGQVAGCICSDGYICIRIDGRPYKAHRLAWLFIYGKFPNGDLDHKNRIRNDNRISNLRNATESQGMANRPGFRNGLKGTYWNKGKWQAHIGKDGQNIYLGRFETEQAAHDAYWAAAQELHGEFACEA